MSHRIAVVVPCYRVTAQLEGVLRRIGPEVESIYCVDDACPENSGEICQRVSIDDPRIRVIRHEQNLGVGGAVMTGYRRALDEGAEIVVKIDGDGQMPPEMIPLMIRPIADGQADYVKGNRFFQLENLRSMPWTRLLGNAGLSFLSKLSSGYWNLFDPTNGFTVIHTSILRQLPLEKISQRYFFESDMLFRLNTLRAVVVDVPMQARYEGADSSLRIGKCLVTFPWLHLRNFGKRLFYNYFLRDFNIASINLCLGVGLTLFGFAFGVTNWVQGAMENVFASAGTVMLAALPMIIGAQLLLSFLHFDLTNIPRDSVSTRLTSAENQDPPSP